MVLNIFRQYGAPDMCYGVGLCYGVETQREKERERDTSMLHFPAMLLEA